MPELHSRLKAIVEAKKREVERLYSAGYDGVYRNRCNKWGEHLPPTRSFYRAITDPEGQPEDGLYLMAEFKRASPSKGEIRTDLHPEGVAALYERAGAVAMSVLTDPHFQGTLRDLERVRESVSIPVLRKDFMLDPVQVREARVWGADVVLLIAAILEQGDLKRLYDLSGQYGMDCLVEVHNREEVERVLDLEPRPKIMGINNRDLHTFEVSLETTEELRPHIPEDIVVVTESGIKTRDDVERFEGTGISAFLMGEHLMREKDMTAKIRELGIRYRPGYPR